jgi:hypothetical protein
MVFTETTSLPLYLHQPPVRDICIFDDLHIAPCRLRVSKIGTLGCGLRQIERYPLECQKMRGVMCLIMEKAAIAPSWESCYIVSDVNKVLQAWKVKLDTVLSESRKSWAGNASSSLSKENISHRHPFS